MILYLAGIQTGILIYLFIYFLLNKKEEKISIQALTASHFTSSAGEDLSFVPTRMRTSFTARILRHCSNAIIIIITITISPINLTVCF